jgi:putative membrane protein
MIWDISIGLAWVFNWIIMLLFWAGLIIIIVWVVKKLSKGGGSAIKKSDPLDIAKERYAKGEITKAEFEQFKKDLS